MQYSHMERDNVAVSTIEYTVRCGRRISSSHEIPSAFISGYFPFIHSAFYSTLAIAILFLYAPARRLVHAADDAFDLFSLWSSRTNGKPVSSAYSISLCVQNTIMCLSLCVYVLCIDATNKTYTRSRWWPLFSRKQQIRRWNIMKKTWKKFLKKKLSHTHTHGETMWNKNIKDGQTKNVPLNRFVMCVVLGFVDSTKLIAAHSLFNLLLPLLLLCHRCY